MYTGSHKRPTTPAQMTSASNYAPKHLLLQTPFHVRPPPRARRMSGPGRRPARSPGRHSQEFDAGSTGGSLSTKHANGTALSLAGLVASAIAGYGKPAVH